MTVPHFEFVDLMYLLDVAADSNHSVADTRPEPNEQDDRTVLILSLMERQAAALAAIAVLLARRDEEAWQGFQVW